MDMRDQIIDIATDLFMTKGFAATSTRQIARILKITQPALYHHFKNKEELYIEVVIKFTKSVGSDLREIVNNDEPIAKRLMTMTHYLHVNHQVNLSMMLHDMDQEISSDLRASVFKIWWENYYGPIYQFFRHLSEMMIDDIDPSKAARHYLSILSAYMSEKKNQNFDSKLQVKEIMMIFLRGITKVEAFASLGLE